ncbi:MAG: hypothetical protein ACHRHE_15840 [Tepidisphaerales bacterium]
MKSAFLTTGMGVLAIGLPVFAQSSVDKFSRQLQMIQQQTRERVNPDVPPEQRARIDYGGYFAANFLAIDDTRQSTHVLFQPDLVTYFRLNVDGAHEVFFRARASARIFEGGDSFDTHGDTQMAIVEQAFYRFNLGRYLASKGSKPGNNDFTITGGRQFVLWANGLVLGQYLDGITSDITLGNVDFSLLAGVTVGQLTVDFDNSRRSFDDHTHRGFYGGMVSTQVGNHKPFLYGMIQRDYNDDDTMVVGTGPSSVNTDFEYNSWYVGGGVNGSFGDHLLYTAEVVYEGGNTLSNSFAPSSTTAVAPVNQEKEDISAAAADFKLDYVFGDPGRSRISVETILATGANRRLSSTSATFGGIMPGNTDHSFNALGLLNTGMAFSPAVSNLTAFRVGGSTYPFASKGLKRLQVGADFFVYGKFNSNAPIDEPTNDDWFLGVEPDVYLNWQITSDVTFAFRYGVFFPGSTIVQDEHPRNFVFAGFTFAF